MVNIHTITALGIGLVAALGVQDAGAAALSPFTTITDTDWRQAGVGGVGDESVAHIDLVGVLGPVTHAYLYWDGISNADSSAVYSDSTITFNGNDIVGTAIGDSSTRGWGPGSSRVYRANVTGLVTGNGTYNLANMADCAGCDVNGASLVVTFNDGNSANNRDIYIFNGNDSSHAEGFPGETDGWDPLMPGILYGGGSATISVHVADGQQASDGNLTITATPDVGGSNPLVIVDSAALFDGNSLPDAGHSRLEEMGAQGDLFDIHEYTVTGLFNGTPGTYALSFGLSSDIDIIALDVVIVDVATVPRGPASAPEPGALSMLALGLAGLGFTRRRRR